MTVGAANKSALTGPKLVQAFLEELSKFLRRCPDHEYIGTPAEIVEEVVLHTDRFGGCGEECVQNLSRQMAMAIKAQGRRYNLCYEPAANRRLRVAVA